MPLHEKHGATKKNKWTRTYQAWKNMKARCFNKNGPDYKFYGERGITVCDEWKSSFRTFLADMGECPEGLTLDRTDHNGNYEKKNCRWITQKEQKANTRRNVFLTLNGETLHLSAWAERVGMSADTIWARYKAKWPARKIIERPLGRWPNV